MQRFNVNYAMGIFTVYIFSWIRCSILWTNSRKNPHKSSEIASVLFICGLLTTAFGLLFRNFWIVLIGYGALNGIAQGIAYLTPVKTLMLWFKDNKGLASAVSIVSFGLGSTLCTWLINIMSSSTSLDIMFIYLAGIYGLMMFIGSMLIFKPFAKTAIETKNEFSYVKDVFCDRMFWQSWLFMFINISAGLALISCSANIFKAIDMQQNMIVLFMLLAGIFNGSFRLIFAWISDFLKIRIDVWMFISLISIICMIAAGISYAYVGIVILAINSTYGGGFSTLPSILADYYNANNLSRLHGAVLSAWAFAGLVGNNIASIVYSLFGNYYVLIFVLLAMYLMNILNVYYARKTILKRKSENE